MIHRVSFVIGGAFALAGLPLIARGEEPSPEKPSPTSKPHVHGANGVVVLPEHRHIEWTMDVLDGPAFRLSAYRGKVVFVNVFATWCGPCRAEQPMVVEFADAHPDDTVVIGVDVQEEDNFVRAYRKKYAITYPIAMDRYDRSVRGIYHEGKMIFPTTVVFKPDGTLSCAWEGTKTREWFENERNAALGEAG